MRQPFLFLLLVLLMISIINPSRAQWVQTNGPYGGTVQTFAVSSTNTVVRTVGGVFLSTNNGTNWTATNTGLPNTVVNALAFSGTNLFAGTSGGGVFLSTNSGTSWTAVNTGLPLYTQAGAFAVYGTNLFVGTSMGVRWRYRWMDINNPENTA